MSAFLLFLSRTPYAVSLAQGQGFSVSSPQLLKLLLYLTNCLSGLPSKQGPQSIIFWSPQHFIFMMDDIEKTVFPSINNIIVNKEFVGIGHRLQDRRRQRRQIDKEAQALQSRVMHLERENYRFNKQAQQKQERLQQILRKRQRQQQDSRQKQRVLSLRMEQLQRLKQQSQIHRINHRYNLNEGLKNMYMSNRTDALSLKQDSKRWSSEREAYLSSQLSKKQDQYLTVNEQKQQGKINVIDFKRQRNRQAVKEYEGRIASEQQNKLKKLSLMHALEQREYHLIQKLRKSSQLHEQLDEKISKAHQVQLKNLQQMVLVKTTKPGSSRSRITSQTEDKMQTLSSKDRQPAPIRENRLDLDGYRRKLAQISHTIDIIDKPFMMGSALEGMDQQKSGKYKEKKGRARRKRHKRHSVASRYE